MAKIVSSRELPAVNSFKCLIYEYFFGFLREKTLSYFYRGRGRLRPILKQKKSKVWKGKCVFLRKPRLIGID